MILGNVRENSSLDVGWTSHKPVHGIAVRPEVF